MENFVSKHRLVIITGEYNFFNMEERFIIDTLPTTINEYDAVYKNM